MRDAEGIIMNKLMDISSALLENVHGGDAREDAIYTNMSKADSLDTCTAWAGANKEAALQQLKKDIPRKHMPRLEQYNARNGIIGKWSEQMAGCFRDNHVAKVE
jgi:hypothetical protein